jgi:hypothetical protein
MASDGILPRWRMGIREHRDRERSLYESLCQSELRSNQRRLQVISPPFPKAITNSARLAPESSYLAAVHDGWEALLWVQAIGTSLLSLNLSKAAMGGSSASGNLAAIMCHKALSVPSLVPKFLTQLLIVPVTDNTTLVCNSLSWREGKRIHTRAAGAENAMVSEALPP